MLNRLVAVLANRRTRRSAQIPRAGPAEVSTGPRVLCAQRPQVRSRRRDGCGTARDNRSHGSFRGLCERRWLATSNRGPDRLRSSSYRNWNPRRCSESRTLDTECYGHPPLQFRGCRRSIPATFPDSTGATGSDARCGSEEVAQPEFRQSRDDSPKVGATVKTRQSGSLLSSRGRRLRGDNDTPELRPNPNRNRI